MSFSIQALPGKLADTPLLLGVKLNFNLSPTR